MIRWILMMSAVFGNAYLAYVVLVPRFVTWAQISPKEISCLTCLQPEVQAALIKAVEYGRSEIIFFLPNIEFVLGLIFFNIVVIAVLLFKSP